MQTKSHAIDRLLRERPHLRERRFGLPYIGARHDGEQFNPTVQAIADAIDFYGFGVRDENIAKIPDTDLGSGNFFSTLLKKFAIQKNPFLKFYINNIAHLY